MKSICTPGLEAAAADLWEDEAAFLSEIIETQSDIAAVELDLRTIMQLVAERTQMLTRAGGASVQIVEGDHLICRAVSGMMAAHLGARFSLTSSLTGHSLRSGCYAYCPDATTDPRIDCTATAGMGIRSLIVVPIFHGPHAVGTLNVSSATRAAFKPRHVSALRLMAGLVAAALSHSGEFEAKKALLAERTAALAALRDSEERFHSAFKHAAIGMAIVGLDGRWLQVNRSLCQIVGYTEHELLLRDFQSLTHPDDLDADLAHVRRLVAGEVLDFQLTKRYLHRQGRVVWVLLSVSLVRDADGKPIHFISQIQDVTARKQAEDALRASAEEYRATFELAGVGKAQVDLTTGRLVRVNAKLCEMLGYTADELSTKSVADITGAEHLAASIATVDRMRRGVVATCSTEKCYVRRDGRGLWATMNATVIHDAGGTPARAVATLQDVTERKRNEWLERDRRQVLEMVAREMPLPDVLDQLAVAMERQFPRAVAAVVVPQDGEIQLHGPNLPVPWQKSLQERGLALAASLATRAWDAPEGCGITLLAQDEIWRDTRSVAECFGLAACWTTSIRGNDSAPLGLLMIFGPDTAPPAAAEVQTLDMAAKLAAICIEHHNTARQLTHLARHDSLTGLANRIMFEDRLEQALVFARRRGEFVGVLLLDIDRFKSINDTLGHHAGDNLLQQFSARLRGKLRETDTIARMGGDEFAVVLPGLHARQEAADIARTLVESLTEPFAVGEQGLLATTSIGIAVFPGDADDAAALQRKADQALYRAKAQGRNGYSF